MQNRKVTDQKMVFIDTEGGDSVAKIPAFENEKGLENINQLIEIGAIKIAASKGIDGIVSLSQEMFPNGLDLVTPFYPVARVQKNSGESIFSARCSAVTDIPPDVSACHGYRYEDLEAYGTHEALGVMKHFAKEYNDDIWVIQNPDYDYPVIKWHAEKEGVKCEPSIVIDTLRFARRILTGKCPNFRLGTMMHYFKCPKMPWHTAFPDAVTSAMIFKHLVDMYIAEGGEDDVLALTRYIYRPAIQETMLFGKLKGSPVSEVEDSYLAWYFHPKQRSGYSGYRNLDMEYTMILETVRRSFGNTAYYESVLESIVSEYYGSLTFPIGFKTDNMIDSCMKNTEEILSNT